MAQVSPSPPGACELEKPFLFVSYARKNRDLVYPEVDRLEMAGYRLWCDRYDIRPGRIWPDEITAAIRDCDGFLIFVSEATESSEWVRRELDLALEFGKFLVAVYLEKVDLPDDLRDKIGDVQGLEFYALRQSEYEENLFVALFDCVGPPSTARKPYQPPIDDPEPYYLPAARETGPIWPKIVVFVLLTLVVLFALLGVMAFILPYFPSQDPGNILSNREFSTLAGLASWFFAAVLTPMTFGIYWIFVRRRDG